jgi:hypothetical protein
MDRTAGMVFWLHEREGMEKTGQEALVRCSGADGARDCGCGAAEVAKIRARDRIKEVEEGSWTRCGTKKRNGQAGAAAGGRRHAWRLRATAARRGGAGKS